MTKLTSALPSCAAPWRSAPVGDFAGGGRRHPTCRIALDTDRWTHHDHHHTT